MKSKIGLMIFIVCIAIIYCPNIVHAWNIGADIKICLDQPMSIFDPDWPDLYFTTTGDYSSGNYFYNYDLVVDKWIPPGSSPGYWERKYDPPGIFTPYCGGASPCPPGTYAHIIPPGILDVDGSSYRVLATAYGSMGDWTPWATGTFTLVQKPGICGTTVTDGILTCPNVDVAGFSDYPNLCLQYSKLSPPNPTNPTSPLIEDGSLWSWDCSGSVGLPPTSCQERVRTVTDTECGSVMEDVICAPSGTITTDPNRLCDITFAPVPVTNIGTIAEPIWTWKCTADCGITSKDQTCSRGFTPRVVPTCGNAAGKNFCNDETDLADFDTSELCSGGSTFIPGTLDEEYNEWVWECSGLCSTTSIKCKAGNSKSCGWIETN